MIKASAAFITISSVKTTCHVQLAQLQQYAAAYAANSKETTYAIAAATHEQAFTSMIAGVS